MKFYKPGIIYYVNQLHKKLKPFIKKELPEDGFTTYFVNPGF